MTRTGKIARLPRSLRHELNTRLENGEPARTLLQWLNALPEVQSILESTFEGRPISEQNLSEWKTGGFLDWQRNQQSCDRVRELIEVAGQIDSAAGFQQVPDCLASYLTGELANKTRQLLQTTVDPGERSRYLRDALQHLNKMRQGARLAAQAARDRFRLELESARREEEQANLEIKGLIDEATKPIFEAMRRETVAKLFSGCQTAGKIADLLVALDGSDPPSPT